MCLRFAGDGQSGHVGSSPYHCCRLLGDGKTSYVARKMKLGEMLPYATVPSKRTSFSQLPPTSSTVPVSIGRLPLRTLFPALAGAPSQRPHLCAEMELPCAKIVCSLRGQSLLPCCTRPMMSQCLRSLCLLCSCACSAFPSGCQSRSCLGYTWVILLVSFPALLWST